jgi:capsular polysaccharide biosynthesis protein
VATTWRRTSIGSAEKPRFENASAQKGVRLSPSESRDAITPQRVAQVLWHRKLVCSVVAAVVAIGGAGLLLTRQAVYQSSSSVALLPVSTNASVLPNYPNLITSLIPTYVQLVSSPALLNRVAGTLPFAASEAQLAGAVHAEAMSSAAIINIVAESPDAIHAQEIAARTTAAFLTDLRGNGVVRPQIYGQPTVPDKPTGPRTKLLLGAILVIAVILGLCAGLVWDRLFPRADIASRRAMTQRSEKGGDPRTDLSERDVEPRTVPNAFPRAYSPSRLAMTERSENGGETGTHLSETDDKSATLPNAFQTAAATRSGRGPQAQ